ARSRLLLSAGFIEIAKLLELPEKSAEEKGETIRAVSRWLEMNDDWLLILNNVDEILDDVDGPKTLKELLPKNSKSHILITSRARNLDKLGIKGPIRIGEMSPDEALQFLFKRTE